MTRQTSRVRPPSSYDSVRLVKARDTGLFERKRLGCPRTPSSHLSSIRLAWPAPIPARKGQAGTFDVRSWSLPG